MVAFYNICILSKYIIFLVYKAVNIDKMSMICKIGDYLPLIMETYLWHRHSRLKKPRDYQNGELWSQFPMNAFTKGAHTYASGNIVEKQTGRV